MTLEQALATLREDALSEEIAIDPALVPALEDAKNLPTQEERFARLRELGLGKLLQDEPSRSERVIASDHNMMLITLGVMRVGEKPRSWNLKISLRNLPRAADLDRVERVKKLLRVPVGTPRRENPKLPRNIWDRHFYFVWDEN